MLSRIQTLKLLSECVGDEIWSAEHCLAKGVPTEWVDQLADCFESGFRSDRETIYHKEQIVNQYHGVRDVDLAYRLAGHLGVDTKAATATALGHRAEVRALRESVEEM